MFTYSLSDWADGFITLNRVLSFAVSTNFRTAEYMRFILVHGCE